MSHDGTGVLVATVHFPSYLLHKVKSDLLQDVFLATQQDFNVWVGRYHVLVAEIIIHPLLKEDDTFPLDAYFFNPQLLRFQGALRIYENVASACPSLWFD